MINKSFTNLGKYLKDRRTEMDLTQAEVAEALGLHSQFASNWERGLCAPPKHAKDKLAKLLRLSEVRLWEVMMDDASEAIGAEVKKEYKLKYKEPK